MSHTKAEANAATIEGSVAFWFPPISAALSGIREGKLLALGVTSAKRSALLPQVPTMAEAGFPNMEEAGWWGMWAPAGIPTSVADKLASDVARALAVPDVREKFAKSGAEPMSMTSAEFGRFVRSEIEAGKRTAKSLAIKPQ